MKKIITLAALALIVASCAVASHPRVTETSFTDYRPYTSAGFFLSPDAYPGEHDVLGEITIRIVPELLPRGRVLERQARDFGDGVYNQASTMPKYITEDITTADMLDAAVKKAKEVGADGLVNLRYDIVTSEDVLNPKTYIVSGLAIRRK